MEEWIELGSKVWERHVQIGGHDALARVEREQPSGTTWAMRILWSGRVHACIVGYSTPAHARHDIGLGVVKALQDESVP
jgi:hypothetical protein